MRKTRKAKHRVVIGVAIILMLAIGGMLMLGCLRNQIMDGGDPRNPDFMAAAEEIDAAFEDVECISYSWQHASMPMHRYYSLAKRDDAVYLSYSIRDTDENGKYYELDVEDKSVDPALFDEALGLLKEDRVNFIWALMDEKKPNDGNGATALDADSSSISFRSGGRYYNAVDSSGGVADFLQQLVNEDYTNR